MFMLMFQASGTKNSDSAGQSLAEQEIPDAPPPSLRAAYLKVSWSYVYWCIGMLAWCCLCVGYFILTRQMLEMTIGICLGLLLLAMILFPAALFGGETWYKRVGWVTILTTLFSFMFAYPLVVVGIGIKKRIGERRYLPYPSFNDGWHLLLSVLTMVVGVWSIWLAIRSWRLTRTLQRGEFKA